MQSDDFQSFATADDDVVEVPDDNDDNNNGGDTLPNQIDKLDGLIAQMRRKMITHDSEMELLKVIFFFINENETKRNALIVLFVINFRDENQWTKIIGKNKFKTKSKL